LAYKTIADFIVIDTLHLKYVFYLKHVGIIGFSDGTIAFKIMFETMLMAEFFKQNIWETGKPAGGWSSTDFLPREKL
jgi:hypothetical protein